MRKPRLSSVTRVFFVLCTSLTFAIRQGPWGESGTSAHSFPNLPIPQTSTTRNEGPFHSAILVAGSRGYGNYRHQADMCHAFQVLKANGLHSDDIITFIFGDVAFDRRNKYRGKLYNRPGGSDVYNGCNKDYTGTDVNKNVLFAVLKGDYKAVVGVGSGRVLRRNPWQKVFFAYADHGSPGVLGFPTGPPLYADELNKVVIEMKRESVFEEMVLYVESCYGGSMFQGMEIEREASVLAVTAASSFENSYATYCPLSLFGLFLPWVTPAKIGSCMGDRFTVAWIEDTESHDVRKRTLAAQLRQVLDQTSASGTYRQGSHVTSYGDTKHTIVHEMTANFMSGAALKAARLWNSITNKKVSNYGSYKQTDADLLYLQHQASSQRNKNAAAVQELEQELARRSKIDGVIYSSLQTLLQEGELVSNSSINKFSQELIPNAETPDHPIVNNWDCLREMVAVWEEHCGPLDTYAGQYTRTFVNLCNASITPSAFRAVLNC